MTVPGRPTVEGRATAEGPPTTGSGLSVPTTLARLSRPGAARRTVWGLADQALSSLTNFALSIAIARQVSPTQFGAFSIAFAAYLVALTVSRAIATDPLTIRYSAGEVTEWRKATARATGTSLAFGILAGLGCLLAAIAIGGDIGAALGPLGVGLPMLLLQDAWRYAFFAAARGVDAFLNDLAWTIALALALAVVAIAGQTTIAGFVVAWAVGGTAGALFGIVQSRVVPRPAVGSWLREHRDIAPRMAVEGVILSASQQILLVVVGIVAGLASVAAVRAGQVLMNALHIATYGIYLAVVPEGVRLLRQSTAALRRLCLIVAGGLTTVTVAWGIVLMALPDPVGHALLGQTWTSARGVILPMMLVTVGGGIQMGAVVGLRALAAARQSLGARAVSSLLLFAGGLIGAELAGANGTAWGMATGVLLGSVVWWGQLLRGLAAAKTPDMAAAVS